MSFLQMSVSAGVLVIAIVLVRAVALNRLPKKMFLALWGVALFRLLVPVSIPLPFNVPSIFISIDEVTRTVLPGKPAPPVGDNPINTGEMIIGTPGAAEQMTEAAQWLIPNIAPTTAIWLAGMLAAFIFFTVIHYRNQRRLRFATAIRDNDFLNEWLAGYRLLRSITIMQSDRIISPLAVGIFKPRIILPKSINMSDKQQLDYVLTHEYYHIKRYDALWKMVLLLALCVHWFNPVVWVMFVLASRDLELTCDEMVLRHFGSETKKDYAKILIGMIEQGSKFAPLYNGFSKNATQERIVSIMKSKKATLFAVITAVVLVSALTVGVLAASATNNDNTLTPKVSAAFATPDREVDSSLPDGYYESKDLLGAEDDNWEEAPIEVDSMPAVLVAVNQNDENRFTPEEWADILEKVETGEILFFDTLEEEVKYFHNSNNDVVMDNTNAAVFGTVSESEISFPDRNVQIADDYTDSFDEQGDYIIDLAKDATLEVGKQYVGEGQLVTFNVTSRYNNDIVIGIKSLTTGQVYSEILKTGTGLIVIDVPVADEYSFYIENISLTGAKLTVSYIVN